MADECAQVLGKGTKGVIATLRGYCQRRTSNRDEEPARKQTVAVAASRRTYLEAVDEYKK